MLGVLTPIEKAGNQDGHEITLAAEPQIVIELNQIFIVSNMIFVSAIDLNTHIQVTNHKFGHVSLQFEREKCPCAIDNFV